MNAKLLIIDPQNDFCDQRDAALEVAGARSDLNRLVTFMDQIDASLTEVIVTLDSHPQVAIERVTFWENAKGAPVAPFTQITHAQVLAGEYLPRNKTYLTAVKSYLSELEAQGRYRLMVWPVHCVIGTWGHNIYAPVARAIGDWEVKHQSPAMRVLKGQNMMTEQYSAVRAEVPYVDDPRTHTNTDLVFRAAPDECEYLFVAGEASSHCVAATMGHLFELFSEKTLPRIVLLKDCMSPVNGFKDAEDKFFARAQKLGVKVMTSVEALKLI